MNAKIKFFLKLLVSLALLVILFLKIDIKEFLNVFGNVNVYFLLLAFALTYVAYVISTYKWMVALLAQGIKISFAKLLDSYASGMFLSIFLPTAYGGDLIRVYDTARLSKKSLRSFTAVFIDRYIGLIVLLLIGFFASLFLREFLEFSFAMLISILLLILIFPLSKFKIEKSFRLITRHDKNNVLRRLRESVFVYNRRPRHVFSIFVFSLLLQTNVIVINYVIALGIGLKLPFSYFFFMVPLVNVIASIPFSVNGLGVREFAYIYIFALANVPNHIALFMSLTVFVVRVIASLIGGMALAFRGSMYEKNL